MNTSDKVRAALSYSGKRQIELANLFNMRPSNLGTKMARNSWSAADLTRVAAFIGAKIGFIFPDGTTIYLDAPASDDNKKDPDV